MTLVPQPTKGKIGARKYPGKMMAVDVILITSPSECTLLYKNIIASATCPIGVKEM